STRRTWHEPPALNAVLASQYGAALDMLLPRCALGESLEERDRSARYRSRTPRRASPAEGEAPPVSPAAWEAPEFPQKTGQTQA
ncbi:MAG TPA: hypothetical protein VN896_09950, partial [Methylomirabilota bacterium]|nr:hypothetical protein [Methylomirabilota bacterium]